MANSTHASEQIIKLLFTNEPLAPRPAQWFVAAHTENPGMDGEAHEVDASVDAAYARRPVSFSRSNDNGVALAVSNDAVTFADSGSTQAYTVRFISIRSELSGGVAFAVLPLDPPRSVEPGGALHFPANQIIIEGYCDDY